MSNKGREEHRPFHLSGTRRNDQLIFMTIKELKEMINLMNEHGLTELEIEKNGEKIKLKKGSFGTIEREPVALPQASVQTGKAPQTVPSFPVEDPNLATVRSPMVGTFYAAPAPEAEVYVTRGKEVNEGDVLCIIEAMKLMNEIKSEVRGRVVDVLVENGQPVEFDQPLFKIQKS